VKVADPSQQVSKPKPPSSASNGSQPTQPQDGPQ
jgi:hypothetical protein